MNIFNSLRMRLALREMRNDARREGDRAAQFAIAEVLNDRRLFRRVHEAAQSDFNAYVVSVTGDGVSVQELGDGTLFKMFLDWLNNGGWEKILELIFRLIDAGL